MMIMTNVLLLVQMLAFSKIPPFGKSNHHGDQLHLMYVRLRIIHIVYIICTYLIIIIPTVNVDMRKQNG